MGNSTETSAVCEHELQLTVKLCLCNVLVEGHHTVTARGGRDTPGFKKSKQESKMRNYTKH